MWIDVLSPEGGQGPSETTEARPLPSLQGALIALHDNAKPGALDLLGAIGNGLTIRGARTRSWSKAHAARPSHHIPDVVSVAAGAVFALGD